MASQTASAAGAYGQGSDDDRLDRRDLLVLKLELRRRRKAASGAAPAQRATRSTR